MPTRFQHLEQTIRGYQMTGVPLIEHNGSSFLPAGVSDDTGIYYFIPKISSLLNLNLEHSIFIFFSGLLICSMLISFFSIWNILQKTSQRIFAGAFLLVLCIYLILRGDIYILSATTALTIIPLCYYLQRKKLKNYLVIIIYLVFGFLISMSNFIRSNSATSVLLFLFVFTIIEYRYNRKMILFLLVFLFIGILLGNTKINSLKHERDSFLTNAGIRTENFIDGHVFWHSVYLGFGFLNNNYGIQYNDDFAYSLAKRIKPDIVLHSEEYENLIKAEVIKLVKNDPWFIIKTMAAKFGVVLFYLLLFSNIGIYYIIKSLKNYKFSIPITLALIFNLSFPILVMPFPGYMIGSVAIIMIFSILSLGYNIIEKDDQTNFKSFFKKI